MPDDLPEFSKTGTTIEDLPQAGQQEASKYLLCSLKRAGLSKTIFIHLKPHEQR